MHFLDIIRDCQKQIEYIQNLIKDHRKTQIAKSAIALAEDL